MKNLYLIFLWLLGIVCYAQDPQISGQFINPSPATTDTDATTMQLTFINNSSTAIPYTAPISAVALTITFTKFIPNQSTLSGPGLQYYDWSWSCNNCSDPVLQTWSLIGIQNQVVPGQPSPFTTIGGPIYVTGTAIETSINDYGPTYGVGFNANIAAPASRDIDRSLNSNQQSAYTYTLDNVCTYTPPVGTPEITYVGISTLDRNVERWLQTSPDNELGAFVVLESDTKPFVVTRIADPDNSVNSPVEGMVVWDTDDYCLKLYDGTQWKCLKQGCVNVTP